MENTEINEFDSLCDKVRFAVSVGDRLTEEMNKHLDECEECRTFLEQSEKMTEMLGAIGIDTLIKDGNTVADAVMEEINRQAAFTGRKPAKKEIKVFKHFGLVAACVAITVMALPLLKNGVIGASKDAANEYVTEDLAEINGKSVSGNTSSGTCLYSVTDDYSDEEAVIEEFETEISATEISATEISATEEPYAKIQNNGSELYAADGAEYGMYMAQFNDEVTIESEDGNTYYLDASLNETISLTESLEKDKSEDDKGPLMLMTKPKVGVTSLVTDAVFAWMADREGEGFNPDILTVSIVEMDEQRATVDVVYGEEFNSSVILVCTDGVWTVV